MGSIVIGDRMELYRVWTRACEVHQVILRGREHTHNIPALRLLGEQQHIEMGSIGAGDRAGVFRVNNGTR